MFDNAIKDARESISRFPLAFYFAWSDTKARYRRSVLGPLWMVITTAVGVVGLGLLWSVLFKADKEVFIPSLSIGLVVWQFISGCILESPANFVRQGSIIRNIKTPYLIFPVQLLLRHLVNFAHNLIVVALVLIVFPPKVLGWPQFLLIPGLLLLVGNIFWMVTIAGILGARFRDLEQLISAVMPMLFFLTPVIFRPEQLGIAEYMAWLNPLAYLISVVRDPIQGQVPAQFVYIVSTVMMFTGIAIAMWLFNRKQGRIVFWV